MGADCHVDGYQKSFGRTRIDMQTQIPRGGVPIKAHRKAARLDQRRGENQRQSRRRTGEIRWPVLQWAMLQHSISTKGRRLRIQQDTTSLLRGQNMLRATTPSTIQ